MFGVIIVRWSIWFKKVSQRGHFISLIKPSLSKSEKHSVVEEWWDMPVRVIVTFTEDGVDVEYFLPTGKEVYPYFHVKESWSYSKGMERSFVDVWIRRNMLSRFFKNGEVVIEVETDNRYAYAEYEYGRRKSRLYAYTSHM